MMSVLLFISSIVFVQVDLIPFQPPTSKVYFRWEKFSAAINSLISCHQQDAPKK
jgi:hypothetical protein